MVDREFWPNVRDFQEECHNTAEKSGFHVELSSDKDIYSAQVSRSLMLIASEPFEAFEDVRKGTFVNKTWWDEEGKPHGVPIEIADTVIRCLDFAETYGIDLAEALRVKSEFNKTRPYKHNKQF